MYIFLSFGQAVRHVGSWFPDQRSNPSPPAWATQSLNHWTTREVSLIVFRDYSLIAEVWSSSGKFLSPLTLLEE